MFQTPNFGSDLHPPKLLEDTDETAWMRKGLQDSFIAAGFHTAFSL